MQSVADARCGEFRICFPVLVVIAALIAAGHSLGRADEATPAADAAQNKAAEQAANDEARAETVRVARQYELFLGPDRRKLVLEAEPVLLWPNATRATREGATFVWTLEGRPEAIACLWKNPRMCFAFQSLSDRPLVAEHAGRVIWDPPGSGFKFENFPAAPAPADTPEKRLGQMKDLARRFECRLTGDGAAGTREELRLLPKPLYRYKTDRANLVDGALFAFAQGTDPEVVLSIEAQRAGGKSTWKYALTRRSMMSVEADLDGERVWSVRLSVGAPSEPWFHGSVGR